MQLYALEPILKFSIHLSVNVSRQKYADKYVENLKQSPGEI